MISDYLKSKIIEGKGYSKNELQMAGIEWKKGWRSKLLIKWGVRGTGAGATKKAKRLKKEVADIQMPDTGFLFRPNGSGRYHIIVGGRALCRRQPNPRKQIASPIKPDMKFCSTCDSLLETDPDNTRLDKWETTAERKGFYQSWEWKKIRFEVIKMYGASCMCCKSEHRIVVDHIKPRSKFPELELDLNNLQILCNDCNMGKSNDDYTDFRPDRENLLTPDEYAELEHLVDTRHLH